jgi:hypothetical protein
MADLLRGENLHEEIVDPCARAAALAAAAIADVLLVRMNMSNCVKNRRQAARGHKSPFID